MTSSRRRKAAMAKAYAPYSKFPVGAAAPRRGRRDLCRRQYREPLLPPGLVRRDDRDRAHDHGRRRKIVEIAVIAEKWRSARPAAAAARRSPNSRGDKRFYLCDETGVKKTMTMEELLPHGFATDVIG
jgi:cytidine deaminase